MAAGIGTTTSAQGAEQAASTSSARGIADNFDAFLMLLTTQLKNQSPLEPLNANEFTQQLVQFASVEQQIKSNTALEALLATSRAANIATAASFVGMRVQASGETAQLVDGQAEWTLDVPRSASRATIEIRDQSGNVVATNSGSLDAGRQIFSWDGMTSTGLFAPPGAYTLRVTAIDGSGAQVPVSTEIDGVVDSLDLSGSEPILVIGSNRVPLTQIKGATR
ncbi:MAG: flagellar hook assembly protein FlgD [Microvirga sp.]|nr:flagellar hook assembly protein FlgD [Microvirga sp.]